MAPGGSKAAFAKSGSNSWPKPECSNSWPNWPTYGPHDNTFLSDSERKVAEEEGFELLVNLRPRLISSQVGRGVIRLSSNVLGDPHADIHAPI